MPGMSKGVLRANPTIVSAFQSSLLHQALVLVLVLVLLAVAWNVLRWAELRRARASGSDVIGGSPEAPFVAGTPAPQLAMAPQRPPSRFEIWAESEPSARRLLRIGFGLLWVFDGILQGQASMPIGMTTSAIEPTARASPHWVQHVVDLGVTLWNDHPVVVAVAVVWIQLGIG